MTPTSRSLEALRKRGCLVAIVEHTVRIPAKPGESPRIFKRDLFGIFDLLALEPAMTGVLGVQLTDASNLAHRIAKLTRVDPEAKDPGAEEARIDAVRRWLEAANRIEVHGWSLRGLRGRPKRWGCTVLDMVLRDGKIVDVRREGPAPMAVQTSAPGPATGEEATR